MKQMRIYIAIAVLVLASLACQTVAGGPDSGSPSSGGGTQPTEESSGNDSSGGSDVESEFPMTPDAYNITVIGDGSLLFYTKLSSDEALEFYRDTYTAKGYTERELLTTVSGGTFSIVFDGDPSGKAVVIQSVDLGDGSRTIAIRLEDV